MYKEVPINSGWWVFLFYYEGLPMNNRQLEYFIEVYKYKSFKKAAEYFMVSPQGINKMIKALEQELGEKLFIHKKNSIEATPAADELYPHATTIIEEFRSIENGTKKERKKITIYTIDSVSDYYLGDFLVEYLKKHQNITLKIMQCSNQEAIDHLKRHECDFAILQEPFSNDEIKNDYLFTAPFVLIMNRAHVSDSEQGAIDKVFEKNPIGGRGFEYVLFERKMKNLHARDIYPITLLESNDEKLLIRMVEADLLVAAVNEAVGKRYESDKIKVVPMHDEASDDKISISYNKQLTKESKEFLVKLLDWVRINMTTK